MRRSAHSGGESYMEMMVAILIGLIVLLVIPALLERVLGIPRFTIQVALLVLAFIGGCFSVIWDVHGPGRPARLKFHDAVRKGDIETAQALIQKTGVVVNDPHGEDYTALAYAAAKGHRETLKLLLDSGTWDGSRLVLALTSAASRGHVGTVGLLISAGAPVDGDAASPGAPLIEACRKRHIEVVKLLVQAGANVNARGVGFWPWRVYTPVAVAQRKGYQDILDILTASRNAMTSNAENILPFSENEKGDVEPQDL